MNIVYLIGMLLAIFFVLLGITVDFNAAQWLNLKDLKLFLDPASALIVIGGTLAVVVACYPKQVKSIPKHFKIMLRTKTFDPEQNIEQLIELAQIARKNGLLALEEKANEQTDPFFKQAIMLIVDATDPDRVKSILTNDIEQTSERHQEVIAMYERGSNAAPAFGMIGTLVGLILMLGNMQDVNALAKGMATALITTLYGSLLANIVCLPVASKLKARHDEEFLCKQLVLEGVLAIQEGENPKFIEEKLYKLLPASRKKTDEDKDPVKEEGKQKKKSRRKNRKNEE